MVVGCYDQLSEINGNRGYLFAEAKALFFMAAPENVT